MLEINLLPPELKKKKKKQLMSFLDIPRELIIGLLGGLLVLFILVHAVFQGMIFFKYSSHKNYQQQWEEIRPEKEEVDKILADLRSLQRKVKDVKGITSEQRIVWAPKLNAISSSVPREVWVTKISLDERALLIQGSAVSKVKNEMLSVGNFVSNLKNEEHFVAGIESVELSSIQRRSIRDTEVVDFVVTAKLE